jgi:hypothetical protein
VTDKDSKSNSDILKLFLMPIIVGSLGCLVAFIGPLLIIDTISQIFWGPVVEYNRFVFQDFSWNQKLFVFLAGNILLGHILIQLLGVEIRDKNEALLTGTLSGMVTGLVISSLVFIEYSKIPADTFTYFKGMFPLLCFLMILTSVIIQVAIMNYWFKRFRRDSTGVSTTKNKITLRIMLFFSIIIIIFIIVLPPGFAYAGIQSGMIERAPDDLAITDMVLVERQTSDSIKATQWSQTFHVTEQYPWLPARKIPLKQPLFQIFVNGKDVSNFSVISENRYPDEIHPPDGLIYGYGSNVTLSGPDFALNKTNPNQIRIVESFQDGRSGIIYYEKI